MAAPSFHQVANRDRVFFTREEEMDPVMWAVVGGAVVGMLFMARSKPFMAFMCVAMVVVIFFMMFAAFDEGTFPFGVW